VLNLKLLIFVQIGDKILGNTSKSALTKAKILWLLV